MKNLQDIYDAYLESHPSAGKIKTASSMMIHICKALDISSQEEVTFDYFELIPKALDSYFQAHPIKATIDKTMLAEMIGRIGPHKKVKKILEKLLSDKDENVRQYTLNSLEYYGLQHPKKILPYIEKYRNSPDQEMVSTAAMLVGNLQCSDQSPEILEWIRNWYNQNDLKFVEEVIARMIMMRKQQMCDNQYMSMDALETWTAKNCPKIAPVVFK
jgi:hypothetical protein